MLPSPRHSRRTLPWPLGLLAGLFVFLDFLIPGMVSRLAQGYGVWLEVFLVCVMVGFVVGQVGLAVLWGAFGSQALAARWLILLAAVELGAGALAVGAAMAAGRGPRWDEFVREAGAILLALPLVFLVLQVPLGFLRAITGWQIAPCRVEGISAGARQFRLADLFTVTGFAAVSLGLAQVGMSLGGPSSAPPPAIVLLSVMGMSGLLAALNAALGLPCLWAVFAARSKGEAIAILLSSYFVVTLVLVMITAIAGGESPPEMLGFLAAFQLVYAAVVWGGLRLLREAQYELVRPRTKRTGTAQIGPTANAGDSPFAPRWPAP